LAFSNPKYVLRPGMSAVVRVHNQDDSPQIVVPSRAVVEQMGEYFLYLAKDTILNTHSADSAAGKKSNEAGGKQDDSSGKKGADTVATPKLRAFQVKVQLGQTIGPNVIIKSGIHAGDRIVVDGVQSIHEGSPINASSRQPGRDSTGTGSPIRDSSKNK
jgi:membrane fusion protein (multidrug efflux system)